MFSDSQPHDSLCVPVLNFDEIKKKAFPLDMRERFCYL